MTNSKKAEFIKKLESLWVQDKFVCVGLDSDFDKIPQSFKEKSSSTADAMLNFNKSIIDATGDLVCAFKPNSAFYEAQGVEGHTALKKTIAYIKEKYPDVPVVLDAKRADIGNTNNGYVVSAFDELGADAITVNPYLGREALQPFLDRQDKGIIVLVKTSNPGAGEFQDIENIEGTPLYLRVARQIAINWNENGNCAVVVGATKPEELELVRREIGDMPILIPGIGAQGGEVESTVKAGMDSRGWGMIINSSRGIIFSDNPRQTTINLNSQINIFRNPKDN